ncbi:tetratricopeptide repeat protein [Streptomyces phaeochromogenes]|uniref:Tetratricopeptide repeat protein n=1 Tax=Streptomyces phaeochromogenes TaxID=1923 RepID=A0ABZ1HJ84_STRPH|nr:tetratricopeptide repeat protein [Streptomyces phaeochromogenes]WSD18275.1 tetratricopeptide repeat protein [Streptomyces phaeochromogenes]
MDAAAWSGSAFAMFTKGGETVTARGISRQELIRRRRRDGFVGRQGELTVFTDVLGQPPAAATPFFFHIHGPAGVGKSTLVHRMQSEARERQAVTGYLDESVADVVEAMEAISTQCSQQGMVLKNFDKALAVYRQRRHEADAAASSTPGTQPTNGEPDAGPATTVQAPSPGSLIASQLGMVGLGMLPGVGAFAGAVDPHQVAAGADRMKAILSTRFRSHDDIQLVISPLKVLTPVFLQDLAEVAQRRPWVVLFLDTYERTGPLLDVWLRDILISDRYGEMPANVLVVLAGQNRLDTRTWADCLDLVADLPLEVFTEAEARRFLASKDITDERTVEVILRLSGRLPVLLSTLAEARPANAEDVGDPSGTAVERFLKWETDSARRAAALACALPQELDEDIFRTTVGAEAADLFGWLRALPFVTDRAGRCRYHDVVRDTMLRLQRQQSPARWKEQHTQLADAFRSHRAQLEEGVPPENDWWESQEWRSLRLQETYHRLCADPHTALSQTLRELLDAYDHGAATLRRWVQALLQVGQDTDAREVLSWGQLLLTALDDEQDPESAALSLLAAGAHLDSDGRAFAHLLRARNYRNADQHEDALIQYNNAITLNSESSRAHYGRGLTYRLMSRHEEALADFDRATELDPQDGSIFEERGVVYFLMGRHEEAVTDLNRAVEIDPQDSSHVAQRGVIYRLIGRHEEALTDLNRATDLKPDYGWAITHRGSTYRLMERYEEALIDFNRAIELDPQDPWNFAERGVAYRLMERYEEALIDFNRAIELDPQADWIFAQRGVTYRLMERYEEALIDFNRAIEIDPQADWIFAQRGVTYRLMERYEEALTDLNRATDLKPNYGWAITQRGVIYRLMGRHEEAVADFNRAVELDPQDSSHVAERGVLHRWTGRHEEALTDFDRAIELDSDFEWAISQRGVLYRLMGRHEEALIDLNRAIELGPQDSSHVAERGVLYRLMGRYEEALGDLNRATDLKPDYGWAISNRGTTYQLMERYEEALGDLNRAVELAPQDSSHVAERGVLHRLMGRHEEAVADLNRAIEIDSDYEWAISNRGTSYRLMGRYEEALGDLNRAIELAPQDGWNFYQKGLVLHLTGDPDWQVPLGRATEIFSIDAANAGPRAVNARGNLFIVCCAMSRWDDADRRLTEFLNSSLSKDDLQEAIADLEELKCVIPSLGASMSVFQNRLQDGHT